ncbi:MAG: protein tyrosine phosphatase [Planctomycetota bacterium]
MSVTAPTNSQADGSSDTPPVQLHVSFICSGNICRSPFAEAALRRVAAQEGWGSRLRVTSAGTMGIVDYGAHEHGIAVAKLVDISMDAHRSRGIDEAYLESVDIVLGLAREHVRLLRKIYPAVRERVFLFGSFPAAHLDGPEIDDPMGDDADAFAAVYREILDRLPPITAELRRRLGVAGPTPGSELVGPAASS